MNNFTNKKWFMVAVLLLLLANAATLVLLWMHKRPQEFLSGPPKPPPGPVFEFLKRELNFNPAQQEAFLKLRDEHRIKKDMYEDSLKQARDAFMGLLKKPAASDSEITAANDRVARLQEAFDLNNFRHFKQIRAICDPAQQLKFDSIILQVIHQNAPQQGPPPRRQPGNGPPPERKEGEGPPPPGPPPPPPPGKEN